MFAKALSTAVFGGALLLAAACASHADNHEFIKSAPDPSDPGLAVAAVAEDKQKGRCDRARYDYDGTYTSVRACEEGDLAAGSCDWHGENIAIFECQYRTGDRDNVGAFVLQLREVSGGRITGLDFVRGPTAQVSADFETLGDWQRWQQRHEDETLTRGLYLWGRVYRRHHRILANPCIQISNAAMSSRSDLTPWAAIADGNYAIVAHRCEGD